MLGALHDLRPLPEQLVVGAQGALLATRPKDPHRSVAEPPREVLLRAEAGSAVVGAGADAELDAADKRRPHKHGTSVDSMREGLTAVFSSRGTEYVSRTGIAGHTRDHAGRHDLPLQSATVVALLRDVGPNISQSASSAPMAEDEKPNMPYFAVGVTTFFVAMALMVISTQKLGYRQDGLGVLPETNLGNPQAEDEPSREDSVDVLPPQHPADNIQYRLQQVLVSWIFIIASIAYFLYYLALQANIFRLQHWFGVVASLQWLFGFMVHIHWLMSTGASRTQLVSNHIKVWACIFAQVHPFSMIMGLKESDPGVWWPPLLAVLLWHVGNIISCAEIYFVGAYDARAGLLAHANLPVIENWVDQLATWLLVTAAFAITDWGGRPGAQLLPMKNVAVTSCQFGGAALFLFASCIRCEWCNGFRNCSHRPD